MEQESFRLLGETSEYRAGVRSMGGKEEIEVLVRLTPPGSVFRSSIVRDMLERLDALRDKGYALSAQDGWWVVCTKTVSEGNLASEERSVVELFESLRDGW